MEKKNGNKPLTKEEAELRKQALKAIMQAWDAGNEMIVNDSAEKRPSKKTEKRGK